MIIDAHAHLFTRDMLPERFWRETEYAFSITFKDMSKEMMKKNFIEPYYDSTPERLIKEMDSAGIDKSIVFSLDWGLGLGEPKISIRDANNFIAEAVKKYPDRLTGFVAIDPRRDNALEIVREGIDNGLSGIKIHPTTGYYPNSKEAYELFEFAESNSLPIISHSGSVGRGLRGKYAQPINFDEPLSDFPKLKISLAHLGMGGWSEEIPMLFTCYPNLYSDISFYGQITCIRSKPDFIRTIRYFLNVGGDKIMFGSDWPFLKVFFTNKQWVDAIQELRNSESTSILENQGYSKIKLSELNRIFSKNVLEFLKK
jgi:predicted TIM-barrel fold metal-dependent hydrolase